MNRRAVGNTTGLLMKQRKEHKKEKKQRKEKKKRAQQTRQGIGDSIEVE